MRHSEMGASLVTVLVSVGLLGLVIQGATIFFKNMSSTEANIRDKANYAEIQSMIFRDIDCTETLAQNGINPNLSCTSTSLPGGQKGPFLRLARKTSDGWRWLTPPLDSSGVARIGRWSIRASCSTSEQTMVIRAAMLRGDGTMAKDHLTGKSRGFDDLLLFGTGDKALPVCFGQASSSGQLIGTAVIHKGIPPGGDPLWVSRSVVVPENTGRVMVTYDANYLLTAPAASPVSEDTTKMRMAIDLQNSRYSGYYLHTGGNFDEITAGFTWSNAVIGSPITSGTVTGDTFLNTWDGPGGTISINLTVSYNPATRLMTISNIRGRRERGEFMVEFYAK